MSWNTGLVKVTGSTIASADRESDVIPGGWRVTCLTMWTHIDQQLAGKGLVAKINYEIVRVFDGQVFNTWWQWNVDEIVGDWGLNLVNIASSFGIESGSAGWAEQDRKGMYIFRPSLIVDRCSYSQNLYQPHGNSEFAVGDDHYFWCE